MYIIRNILQVLSGLMVILLPFIFIYWLLLAVNLEPLQGFISLLGSVFNPMIEALKLIPFVQTLKPIDITGNSVDLTPLVLFIVVFVISSVLAAISKFLLTFQRSVREIKAKTIIETNKQVLAREKLRAEEEILQNNTCFMIVRLVLHKTSSAYLISSGFSEEEIYAQFTELLNKYKYLNANMVKSSIENEFKLVFDEVSEAVSFSVNLLTSLKDLNKKLGKAAVRCSLNIGLHSTKPGTQKAFEIAEKVINLSGENEIVCSKMVREVYMLTKREKPLDFFSKGMYTIDGEMEIFAISG